MLSESTVMENHQHRTACETNTARRRRWLQFRLKWLFVLVAVLAAPLSWLGWKLEEKRRERWAEAELSRFDVCIIYNGPDSKPFGVIRGTLNPPPWLGEVLGYDFFMHVQEVEFRFDALAGQHANEVIRPLGTAPWAIE